MAAQAAALEAAPPAAPAVLRLLAPPAAAQAHCWLPAAVAVCDVPCIKVATRPVRLLPGSCPLRTATSLRCRAACTTSAAGLLLPELQLLMCPGEQGSRPLHINHQHTHPHLWQQALAAAQRCFSRLLKCCHCRCQGAVTNLRRACCCEGKGVDSTLNTPEVAALLPGQLKCPQEALHRLLEIAHCCFVYQGACRLEVAFRIVGLQLAHGLGADRRCCLQYRQLFRRWLLSQHRRIQSQETAAVLQLLHCQQRLLPPLAASHQLSAAAGACSLGQPAVLQLHATAAPTPQTLQHRGCAPRAAPPWRAPGGAPETRCRGAGGPSPGAEAGRGRPAGVLSARVSGAGGLLG